MKKSNIVKSGIVLLLMFAIGCSDPVKTDSPDGPKEKSAAPGIAAAALTTITPGNIGDYHNNALAAIESSFSASGVNPTTLEETDNYARNYELQYFNSAQIDVPESVAAATYPWRNTILPISYQKSTICMEIDVTSIADSFLHAEGTDILITQQERSILHDLFVSLDQYQQEKIDYTIMKDRVANLKDIWNQQGFDTDNHEGDISAYTLNVADASLTYWHDYESSGSSGRVQAIPGILVADAIGAVGGGLAAGLDSYWNTGKVNWKSVGAWALGGALTSSVPGLRIFKKFYAVCPH